MVELDFDTPDLVKMEKWITDFFQGKKAPKMSKDSLKVIKKLTTIREQYQEIDAELEEDE